jgi:BirA family biotin operon repressor/biotin-[acetyl-CoA-carboxylase] ligase
MMAILDSAAIMPRACVAADQVLVLDTVGSTNTYAADLVRAGRLFGMDGMDGIAGNLVWSGREIVVVAANEQTAGRGRLDHTWASVPGESFIVSLVVSVPVAIVRDSSVNGWLQMIAGCEMREAIVGAVCDFGGTLDEDVLLKWPNDIFAGGKKLGGVLAEMVPIPDCGDRVAIVIGVGLNLAVAQERLPIDKSTSLQLVARNLPDAMVLRDAIAVRWVQGLRSRLADFEEDPHREAVRAREAMTPICWTLGKQCEAHFVDGTTLQGRAVALNDDASLTIEDQEGVLHRVSTADVGVLSK